MQTRNVPVLGALWAVVLYFTSAFSTVFLGGAKFPVIEALDLAAPRCPTYYPNFVGFSHQQTVFYLALGDEVLVCLGAVMFFSLGKTLSPITPIFKIWRMVTKGPKET